MSDHRQLALWAADCAERVLDLFETLHPDDARPRQAVQAARQWESGGLAMTSARACAFAAHAAARDAASPAASAAARAAGHAAATAHVATHAPHAATYALKARAFAGGEVEAERNQQRLSLPTHLRNLVP
ncbi:putative immunity protein [Sphingomonas sp.]|uniref:putative immunity protein n=1 Tax=Sphingomonas sp. TaxID=28214 RepID=UPI003D6CEB7F